MAIQSSAPSKVAAAAATFPAECPPTIKCVVVPAAYANNDPANPADYGNYDKADRPHGGMEVTSVVIHNTEGDLESVLNAFQNPLFYVATHYVIDADGTVYHMIPNKHVGWHAANWYYNTHSIGIEHVGHLARGHTEFTTAMYRASAELVKYLGAKYQFPLDRKHILGHDNIPATTTSRIPGMHTDPGPYWNWELYMQLLEAPRLPGLDPRGSMVTVAPVWALNRQPVEGCSPSGACVPPGGPFVSSIAYVRTAPNLTAPFVTDPVLGPGSTNVENTAARVYYGQQFASAGTPKIDAKGIWYQIYYAGQQGWLHSPWAAPTAYPSKGRAVTPKAGRASVPVYGRPLPEQSDYPADFVPPPGSIPLPAPLAYTISAGQRYAVTDSEARASYFFSWTYDGRLPYDGTLFLGATRYIEIQYNGRLGFVKAADVDM